MGIIVAVIVVVLAVGWLGLQVKPPSFADYPEASQPAETIPLPDGLPAPVERYYRTAYGDEIPVVHSVVITGRGRIRPVGLWLPARYRFTHDAGQGYRHYIEATWFGIPVMKVNERYVDGRARMELPWMKDEGTKLDQAANIGMWAELAASAPSVFLTDPRVRWQAVDDETATLVVPLGDDATDTFVVRFDPATGQIASLEAMRYRDSKSEQKVLWIAAYEEGSAPIGDAGVPATGTATWLDQGEPWASFTAEDIRYNVDVDEYLRARGL
jgi:hypothetical protein